MPRGVLTARTESADGHAQTQPAWIDFFSGQAQAANVARQGAAEAVPANRTWTKLSSKPRGPTAPGASSERQMRAGPRADGGENQTYIRDGQGHLKGQHLKAADVRYDGRGHYRGGGDQLLRMLDQKQGRGKKKSGTAKAVPLMKILLCRLT